MLILNYKLYLFDQLRYLIWFFFFKLCIRLLIVSANWVICCCRVFTSKKIIFSTKVQNHEDKTKLKYYKTKKMFVKCKMGNHDYKRFKKKIKCKLNIGYLKIGKLIGWRTERIVWWFFFSHSFQLFTCKKKFSFIFLI